MIEILAAFVLLAAGTPDATPATAESGTKAEAPATPKKRKVVCREEIPTGTRFPKRVCRDAEEWEAQKERDRTTFRDIQNRPQMKICGPGNPNC